VFLYLAEVFDPFSCCVVGWSMANSLQTKLVLDALEMACWQRRPSQVMHRSEQGSQYTSFAFGHRWPKAEVCPLMGLVGDCYHNALCERFFAMLEGE
jgi:putative transposase